MKDSTPRLISGIALAGITWLLLALFVRFERDPSHRETALQVAAAAFVAYLLTIGYAIYLRAYWWRPRSKPGRRGLPPMARWVLTIVGVGAFGITIGLGFPDITQSYWGELFVQTVVFGSIAFGLVSTVSGGLAGPTTAGATEQVENPPAFFVVCLKVVLLPVGALVGAMVLFGPAFLVNWGFEQWIDVPACQQTCAAHGYGFESLVQGKSSYNCNCSSSAGRQTFHERANIGGGKGAGAALLDWIVRAGTTIGVSVAWLALLVVGGGLLWLRARGDTPAAM